MAAWRCHLSRGLRMLRSRSLPAVGQTREFVGGVSGGLSSFGTRRPIPIRDGGGALLLPRQIGGLVSNGKLLAILDFKHSYSAGTSNLPAISDPDVKTAFKEVLAWDWDEIPNSVIHDVKKALSKNTEDKVGQEALKNLFRAAEASVEFSSVLVNIRMALEETTGLTGENVAELPDELVNAIKVAHDRYITYVNSFGPNETYLRKKVEAELGTRLIHLKQRISGLGSEWGDINVIGTSGLSGSYVEQRA